MVYWVIGHHQAQKQQAVRSHTSSLVARLGPFDSVRTAERVRATLASTVVVENRGGRRRAGATATSLAEARRRVAGEVAIGSAAKVELRGFTPSRRSTR